MGHSSAYTYGYSLVILGEDTFFTANEYSHFKTPTQPGRNGKDKFDIIDSFKAFGTYGILVG